MPLGFPVEPLVYKAQAGEDDWALLVIGTEENESKLEKVTGLVAPRMSWPVLLLVRSS